MVPTATGAAVAPNLPQARAGTGAEAPVSLREVTRRIFLALLLVALGLIAAELTLRVLRLPAPAQRTDLVDSRWRPAMDFGAGPGDFWTLRPATGDEPVSALGMRGYDPTPSGPRDLRVAILGGASAYGLDQSYGHTFAARVERALQRELPSARVQTMLAAAPDYSSHQMLAAWRRSVRAFAPHVLVVHSEPWNDSTTAVGPTDAELAASAAARPALHLQALFAHPPEATGAPRVDLEAYRRNLHALFAEATAAKVEILATVAARGPKTLARWPGIETYVRVHEEVAVAAGARLLDVHALISGLSTVSSVVTCDDIGETMAFRDGVHLTAPAHVVIADAIVPMLRTTRRYQELSAASGATPPAQVPLTLVSVAPVRVTALRGEQLTLTGTGLGASGAPRVYIGSTLVSRLTPVDDSTLRATLPSDLVPGTLAIEVVTQAGSAVLSSGVEVLGAGLQASLRRASRRIHVDAHGQAPPGSTVQVWLAHAARTQPVATIAGSFWLRDDLVEAEKKATFFCYGNLPLPTTVTTVGADGTWRISAEIDSPTLMPGTSAALQGVVWFVDRPGHGVTTAVLPLPIEH